MYRATGSRSTYIKRPLLVLEPIEPVDEICHVCVLSRHAVLALSGYFFRLCSSLVAQFLNDACL